MMIIAPLKKEMSMMTSLRTEKVKKRTGFGLNRGFTLIELLVVITIIGVLAALAFPAIQGAIDAGKRAEAKTTVTSIKNALIQYQTDYGNWPGVITSATEVKGINLYGVLNGSDTANNPREIVYMEFASKSLRAGVASVSNKTPPDNLATANNFVDPWHQPYRIVVDFDYNNSITAAGTTVRTSVMVWSPGRQSSYDGTDETKYVKSW